MLCFLLLLLFCFLAKMKNVILSGFMDVQSLQQQKSPSVFFFFVKKVTTKHQKEKGSAHSGSFRTQFCRNFERQADWLSISPGRHTFLSRSRLCINFLFKFYLYQCFCTASISISVIPQMNYISPLYLPSHNSRHALAYFY